MSSSVGEAPGGQSTAKSVTQEHTWHRALLLNVIQRPATRASPGVQKCKTTGLPQTCQSLPFNKMPGWFLCMFNFEKHWFRGVLKARLSSQSEKLEFKFQFHFLNVWMPVSNPSNNEHRVVWKNWSCLSARLDNLINNLMFPWKTRNNKN